MNSDRTGSVVACSAIMLAKACSSSDDQRSSSWSFIARARTPSSCLALQLDAVAGDPRRASRVRPRTRTSGRWELVVHSTTSPSGTAPAMDVPVLDYDGLPDREGIFGKALLDPGNRGVGRWLEEEDAA